MPCDSSNLPVFVLLTLYLIVFKVVNLDFSRTVYSNLFVLFPLHDIDWTELIPFGEKLWGQQLVWLGVEHVYHFLLEIALG